MAGLLRDDLPIGVWSTNSTAFIEFKSPDIVEKVPGASALSPIFRMSALYKISFINVDFPEPLTPVMTVMTSRGNFTSIPFKLFSAAPLILKGVIT